MSLFTKNPLERLMMQRPYPGKEETPRTPAPEGHFCCGCSRYGTVCLRPCYRDTDLREKLRVRTPTLAAFSHRCYNVPMKDQMQRKRM